MDSLNKITFTIRNKELTLYKMEGKNIPLIIFNNFNDDGQKIFDGIKKYSDQKFNFLNISKLNWNKDMTPWKSEPAFKGDIAYLGGAKVFLNVIVDEIIPYTKTLIDEPTSFIGIAGYSLAGLFAIYSMYNCKTFDYVASVSGSLWFPSFKEYIMTNEIIHKPQKIYLSLGDLESKTKNKILSTVYDNTVDIIKYYKKIGLNVEWELNKGNHFMDVDERCVKGIVELIK